MVYHESGGSAVPQNGSFFLMLYYTDTNSSAHKEFFTSSLFRCNEGRVLQFCLTIRRSMGFQRERVSKRVVFLLF